jgi:hypothetical protein
MNMFFDTISKFLSDIKIILSSQDEKIKDSEIGSDPNIISLGAAKETRKEATTRVFAQLVLTLFVIGLCVYVVMTKSDGIGEKLAYTGFGVVFGYWFR